MRKEIIALLILVLFFPLPGDAAQGNGLILNYEAHSTGGEDNSMTTYSYISEPRIQESGFTKGLKSGSFNYFNKGKKIEFSEELRFNYGNATNISNSTVSHTLNLNFEGGNGISEIYASGLFPNNRGLSAWKKIRYETSDTLKTNGKKIREFEANSIKVDASIDMNTRKVPEYFIYYSAGAKDAVIETHDAAGWSNRTGSRRIDVEHATLLTGNFEVNQTFQEIMPPGAPWIDDWLPCCFKGTVPDLRQEYWPAQVVIDTLNEYPLQPRIKVTTCNNTTICGEWKVNNSTKELEKICKLNVSTAKGQIGKEVCGEWKLNNSTKEWEKTCKLDIDISKVKEQTCTEEFKECPTGGCAGFQCINTFNERELYTYPKTESEKRQIGLQLTYGYSTSKVLFPPIDASKSGIDFENDGKDDKADQVVYEIMVKNIGRTSLDNLTLEGTLPANTISNLSYEVTTNESRNIEVTLIDPVWDSTKRSFTYRLGSMNMGTGRTIHLMVFMKEDTNRDDAKFSVIGYAIDGSAVQAKASWLPAYEATIDIALNEALKKKMPPKEMKLTYNPEVSHRSDTINGQLIYQVDVTNRANSPLKNEKLTVELPNVADPELSYEVILRNDTVENVTNLAKPTGRKIEYNWTQVNESERKVINILVSTNSAKFVLDNVTVSTEGERTDGSKSSTRGF